MPIRLRLDIDAMAASRIRSPDAIQQLADIDLIDRLTGLYRIAFKSSVRASLDMCNCELVSIYAILWSEAMK